MLKLNLLQINNKLINNIIDLPIYKLNISHKIMHKVQINSDFKRFFQKKFEIQKINEIFK